MTRHWYISAAAFLLLGADTPQEDAFKQELNSLQGTWMVTRVVQEGKDVTEHLEYDEVFIEGSTTSVVHRGQVRKSRFVINPHVDPKEITYVGRRGNTIRGIYELKGNTWKTHLAKPGAGRPASFQAAGMYYEYTRE